MTLTLKALIERIEKDLGAGAPATNESCDVSRDVAYVHQI